MTASRFTLGFPQFRETIMDERDTVQASIDAAPASQNAAAETSEDPEGEVPVLKTLGSGSHCGLRRQGPDR